MLETQKALWLPDGNKVCHSPGMSIFDDLAAEQERLEKILSGLDERQWRLRHVAWLAHRTLPYALSLAGQPPVPVRCEVTAPDGGEVWRFGPPDAESAITGTAGAFCRVAVRRLDADESGLRTSGPHGATAARALRTFAA